MPDKIPTWKEMTEYEGWGSFDPDKKNRIREKWLGDAKRTNPTITDGEITMLRQGVYAEEQGKLTPRATDRMTTPPPKFVEGQEDILGGRLWDYNTDTRHAVVKDDDVSDWRDASDEERGLIEGAIPSDIGQTQDAQMKEKQAGEMGEDRPAGIGDIGTVAKELARSELDKIYRKFCSPLEYMAKFSAPLSLVAGTITEAAKIKDRGKLELVGDSLMAGFESFQEAVEYGTIKDASTITKEIQGKTLEEQYGLFWGTIANIAASSLIDPLVLGGLPIKLVNRLTKVAKGATTATEAVNTVGKISNKMSPEAQKIIKMASDKLHGTGFKMVEKKLLALGPAKTGKAIGVGKEAIAKLPQGRIPSPAIPTSAGRKILQAPKKLAPAKTGFKIVKRGLRPGTTESQKKLASATTKELPLSKVKGELPIRKAIELPAARTAVSKAIESPKTGVTRKMSTPEVVRDIGRDEVIDTVDKFVASGGKIQKASPVQTRYRTIVGKETVRKINTKAAYELGIDVEVLRGEVRAGDVISDFTREASGGTYLGSGLGGGAEYFLELIERAKGLRPKPKQVDEWVKQGILSVEKQWKKLSPQVGHAFKNMHSLAEAEKSKGVDVMRRIARYGSTGWRGLVKPGVKGKFIREDISDIALSAGDKEYFNKLPLEVRKRIKNSVDEVKKYFKESAEQYRERGVDINFKDRVISDKTDYNASIYKLLKDIQSGKRTKVGLKELGNLGVSPDDLKGVKTTNIKQIKKILGKELRNNREIAERINKLDYVHIPYALWFSPNKGVSSGAMVKALRLANAQKRKTIAITDLIESGAIKKDQANVFDIIGSYADRKGKDFALLAIKKAAVESNLASSKRLPGFVKMDGRKAPLYNDVYMHPAFKKWLYDFQEQTFHQNIVDKAFTMSKLWQFIQPSFLGYYNLQQSAVFRGHGLLNVKGTMGDYGKAMKQMATHNKEYYDAIGNGLLSKPFSVPWGQFKDTVARMSTTSIPENMKLFVKQNYSLIKPVYETLWNTAWVLGDEVHRLATYNYLTRTRGKVMSSFEKAQTAALGHSDYANVPLRTRRFLQKPLFTGPFKITMGRLYKEMIKSVYKVGTKTLTGNYKTLSPKDKLLAKAGINTVVGIMGAMDMTMTKGLGYERDQFARRYYKLIKAEDGSIKENVVVYASPLTLMPRYAQKAWVTASNDNYRDTVLSQAFKQIQYDVHPLINTTTEVLTNRKKSGKPIYDSWNDSLALKLAKSGVYATTQIVKILDDWFVEPDKSNEEAKKIFRKDVGGIFNVLTKPMRFNYLRGPTHERMRRSLKEMQSDCQREKDRLMKDGTLDKKTADNINRNLLVKQTKLLREIEKAEAKFEEDVMKEGLFDEKPRAAKSPGKHNRRNVIGKAKVIGKARVVGSGSRRKNLRPPD